MRWTRTSHVGAASSGSAARIRRSRTGSASHWTPPAEPIWRLDTLVVPNIHRTVVVSNIINAHGGGSASPSRSSGGRHEQRAAEGHRRLRARPRALPGALSRALRVRFVHAVPHLVHALNLRSPRAFLDGAAPSAFQADPPRGVEGCS